MRGRAKDVVVEAGDAEPGVEPARFDGAGAGVVGELVEVREELFRGEDGGVAVAPGDAAAAHHAVEHCFDVRRDSVGAGGGSRGEEPAAFVSVGEHCSAGWIEAANLVDGRLVERSS